MFPIVMGFISIFSAWKWGDWRSWHKYIHTIQYFILGDMLYNLLTWGYPWWTYPHPPNVLPNHLAVNLFVMFTIYPSTMLIFLYHYPDGKHISRKIIYILLWILIWAVWEYNMIFLGYCVYHNGWTYAWSLGFICLMVLMLRLHYKRPLWAYILTIPITVFLLLWFNVPVFQTK